MRGTSPGDFLVDSHCHLNHPRLFRQIPDVIERARAAGVAQMVVVGYDVPSSRKAVEIAETTPEVWAAVGVHPHEAGEMGPEELAEVKALAQSSRVVAIGETGLDFYRNLAPADAQRSAFQKQLDLGGELGLPVITHCRNAQEAVLAALQSRQQQRVVWHCFEGTAAHADRAIELGAMLGFGGLLGRTGSAGIKTALRNAPEDRILLETDSPYHVPVGKDNEPANLPAILEMLARARAEPPARLAALTTANAHRVFKLSKPE